MAEEIEGSDGTSLWCLIGCNLAGFDVLEMYEVYRVDEDGRRKSSVACIMDQVTAQAYAEIQPDDWHRVRPVLVLTDGRVCYLMEDQASLAIVHTNDAKEAIRRHVLGSLTPAQRSVLTGK